MKFEAIHLAGLSISVRCRMTASTSPMFQYETRPGESVENSDISPDATILPQSSLNFQTLNHRPSTQTHDVDLKPLLLERKIDPINCF